MSREMTKEQKEALEKQAKERAAALMIQAPIPLKRRWVPCWPLGYRPPMHTRPIWQPGVGQKKPEGLSGNGASCGFWVVGGVVGGVWVLGRSRGGFGVR